MLKSELTFDLLWYFYFGLTLFGNDLFHELYLFFDMLTSFSFNEFSKEILKLGSKFYSDIIFILEKNMLHSKEEQNSKISDWVSHMVNNDLVCNDLVP